MKRRGYRWLLWVIVVAAAGSYGAYRYQKTKAAPAVTVGRVTTVRTGDMTIKVSETGTLEPVSRVDVKSRVGGRVQRIYIKAGDTVKAGQTLAVVDPTEVTRQVAGIQAQLAAARAGLSQAEENYALTRRQNQMAVRRAQAALAETKMRLKGIAAPSRPQEVEQGQAAVRRAEAQVTDARRNLERKKALVAKGFLAQAEADAAQTQLSLAEADVDSARERVSLLRAGTRREDVETARAAIVTAEAQLASERTNADQAQLRLRDVERARAEVAQIQNQLAQQSVQLTETRIVAPISGEIIGKFLEEGELVASATAGFAQGAAIVTIADLSRMQVRVNVNEVDVARIRPGLPVEVRIDGVPDKVFPGKVASIAPASLGENQKGAGQAGGSGQGGNAVVRFEVKVAVVSPDKRLRPGMTASVDIIMDRRARTLILPTEAVLSGNKVVVVTGTAPALKKETRPVVVGLKNDATTEVLSGLKEGDRVEIPKIVSKDRRKIDISGPD